MQNKPTDQHECQPLTGAEVQQMNGGAKLPIKFPPYTSVPIVIIDPVLPICGPFPFFDEELGVIVY